jgi:PRTRC genetic system protein E
MALFSELYALTQGATIALIMTGDHMSGLMTVNVVPKPKDDHQESGLSQNLTLVATPEEFDAQFVDALRGFRAARSSLLEQAKTTVRVLEAATQASSASANGKGRAKREAARTDASATPVEQRSEASSAPSDVTGTNTAQADLFE